MYLALATGHGHVNETAGVLDTLVGATLGVLLLLLRLDLCSKFSLEWRLVEKAPAVMPEKADVREISGSTCLGGGRLDLTRTSERAVNLTHVG